MKVFGEGYTSECRNYVTDDGAFAGSNDVDAYRTFHGLFAFLRSQVPVDNQTWQGEVRPHITNQSRQALWQSDQALWQALWHACEPDRVSFSSDLGAGEGGYSNAGPLPPEEANPTQPDVGDTDWPILGAASRRSVARSIPNGTAGILARRQPKQPNGLAAATSQVEQDATSWKGDQSDESSQSPSDDAASAQPAPEVAGRSKYRSFIQRRRERRTRKGGQRRKARRARDNRRMQDNDLPEPATDAAASQEFRDLRHLHLSAKY